MKDRIEVASLDGLQRRVIINSDLVNPRAIITDPFSGCVFKKNDFWVENVHICICLFAIHLQ